MREILKRSMVTACVLALLGTFPVMAETSSPAELEITTAASETSAADETSTAVQESSPESIPEEPEIGAEIPVKVPESIDDVLKEEKTSEKGSEESLTASDNVPDTESAEWFSKDSILKIAIGSAVGAALVLVILAIRNMGKKARDIKATDGEEMKEHNVPEISRGEDETEQILDDQSRQMSTMGTQAGADSNRGSIGMVHNVGCRRNQQDTLGTKMTKMGFLAIVSDGMGGLSDGEKVSQKAVMEMLKSADQVSLTSGENPLFEMLSETNEQVLGMLGPDQIYKSGATLLAVLVNQGKFHWIAVGDSRIYLYCSHHLFQINREHIYKQQLIGEAVNKNVSFSRVCTDPQRDRLVSFLGMGDLKYVDGSLRPVDVLPGDKLLLMSDGIFNAISEQEIIRILEQTNNAEEAAVLMERQVLAAGNPKQDNFTCIILNL